MPFLAGLVPLISAIGSIGGLGLGIEQAVSAPGAPAAPKPAAPTPPNPQQLLAQREAVSSQLPNVLSQTSGLASPGYDSLIAQILAGVTGQPGAAAAGASATGQQPFSVANSQPTNAAVTGQSDLSNFVNTSI